MKVLNAFVLLLFALPVYAEENVGKPPEPQAEVVLSEETRITNHLQDISVTVKSGTGEGSGVIITRDVKIGDKLETVNFVWTAAHVVAGLRSTRTVVDPVTGQSKQVIEFKDAFIVKELTEGGRRIGELKMDAKVIKYSDATTGEDLALLIVRKRNFIKDSADFYLSNENDGIVPVGIQLFHVGSLLGQNGSNSMTTGIMSQIGRTLPLGGSDATVFDQSSCPAFPGSSGGGIFLAKNGQYVGMLVRGAGETFNFMVPIRRMRSYASKAGVSWALDKTIAMPSYDDILKLTIE